MAVEIDDKGEAEAPEEEAEASGGRRKWWLIGGGVVLLLALVGGGAAFVLFGPGRDAAPDSADGAQSAEQVAEAEPDARAPSRESREPPRYKSLEPALTVNFSEPSSSGRFLQVVVQVMSRDQEVLRALDDNMPAARNDLIMLLGEQDPVALRTREGKEALQKEVLETLRKVLEREAPGGGSLTQRRNYARGLEAVYFTTFVIQ